MSSFLRKASFQPLFLLSVWVAVQLCAGCRRPSQIYHRTEATEGIEALADRWQVAMSKKKGRAIVRLFWDVCLLRCRGFRFSEAGSLAGETVARFQWVHRTRPGSLPADLMGQLASYRSVRRSAVEITELQILGERRADVRISIAVDGVLRTGHRRSDRGAVRLRVERRGLSGPWKITGFKVERMETLVAMDRGFARAPSLGPGPDDPGSGSLGAEKPDPWPPSQPTVAAGDLDGDRRADLVVAEGGSLVVWKNEVGGKFRRIHRREVSEVDLVGPLTFADVCRTAGPDILVRDRQGAAHLLCKKSGKGDFAYSGSRPLGALRASAAAFVDADTDGHLDLYVAASRGPKAAPPRKRKLSGYLLSGSSRGLTLPRIHTPSLQPSRRMCLSGSPDQPIIISTGARGAHRVDLSKGSPKSSLLARRWASDCAAVRMGEAQHERIAVLAPFNPWRWVYQTAEFPRPLGQLMERPRSWGAELRAASSGSVLVAAPPSKASGKTKGMASVPESLSGWDTAAVAVDVDGDGSEELAVLQTSFCEKHTSWSWSFWVDRFPAVWQKRGSEVSPSCAPGPSRVELLAENSSSTLSDIGWVTGLEPRTSHRGILAFDLSGNGAKDLLLASPSGQIEIFRNELPQAGAVHVEIVGPPGNRSSIGAVARVLVRSRHDKSSRSIARRVSAIPGKVNPARIVIGVGTYSPVEVEVEWPDGAKRARRARAGELTRIAHPSSAWN
jgi:hypothetical protein